MLHFLLSLVVTSQATVKGRVLDAAGAPVAGAIITVLVDRAEAAGKRSYAWLWHNFVWIEVAHSDQDGAYRAHILPRCDYVELQARRPHSTAARDCLIVCELDGHKAGVGRLIELDEHNGELGGIFVVAEFRGKGIVDRVVASLVSAGAKYHTVWCLPFARLSSFYEALRFSIRDTR